GARDAVHNAMVDLEQEGRSTPGDAVDQVRLPQRAVALERLCDQHLEQGAQVALPESRSPPPVDVSRRVELRIVLPGRMREGPGSRQDSLGVAPQQRLTPFGLPHPHGGREVWI